MKGWFGKRREGPLSASRRWRWVLPAFAVALLTIQGCKKPGSLLGPSAPPYQSALTPYITAARLDFMHWPGVGDFAPAVQTFYENRQYELSWSKDGKLTDAAKAWIAAFSKADVKGLVPEDYDASRWGERQAWLSGGKDGTARFDTALTIDVMRYASDLHSGRVSPQHFGFEIDAQSKRLDLPKFIEDQARKTDDVAKLLESIEPTADGYRKLEEQLPKYLKLVGEEVPERLPMVTKPLSVGDRYDAVMLLEQRLSLEGDGLMTAGVGGQGPLDHITQLAADGLKAYQQRHGMQGDGKLDPATIRSLNVPIAERVKQINLSLERWRWLPDPYATPRLMVNLPEFMLRGFSPEHEREWSMRVVSGQMKDDHRTPVFTRTMKYLVFRPYWNVPVDIAKKELVPHMHASADYLEEKDYEVVGHSGKVLTSYTPGQVEHGMVLVRQKPGPTNSLGLVKFMFPNQYDIYMHSTPAMSLFQRQRRDFSHGCVRVQHADDMAVWVLRGQRAPGGGDWDLDKVHDWMNNEEGNNKTVLLKEQLPVVIFYLTAHVGDDGKLDFFDDVYNYDAEMNAVLEKGPPYPTKPEPVTPKTKPGDTV